MNTRGAGALSIKVHARTGDKPRYWHFRGLSEATLSAGSSLCRRMGLFSGVLVAVSRVRWHLSDGPIHGAVPKRNGMAVKTEVVHRVTAITENRQHDVTFNLHFPSPPLSLLCQRHFRPVPFNEINPVLHIRSSAAKLFFLFPVCSRWSIRGNVTCAHKRMIRCYIRGVSEYCLLRNSTSTSEAFATYSANNNLLSSAIVAIREHAGHIYISLVNITTLFIQFLYNINTNNISQCHSLNQINSQQTLESLSLSHSRSSRKNGGPHKFHPPAPRDRNLPRQFSGYRAHKEAAREH